MNDILYTPDDGCGHFRVHPVDSTVVMLVRSSIRPLGSLAEVTLDVLRTLPHLLLPSSRPLIHSSFGTEC